MLWHGLIIPWTLGSSAGQWLSIRNQQVFQCHYQGSIIRPMVSSKRKHSSEPFWRQDAQQLWRYVSITVEQQKHQGAGPWQHEAGTSRAVIDSRWGHAAEGPLWGCLGALLQCAARFEQGRAECFMLGLQTQRPAVEEDLSALVSLLFAPTLS